MCACIPSLLRDYYWRRAKAARAARRGELEKLKAMVGGRSMFVNDMVTQWEEVVMGALCLGVVLFAVFFMVWVNLQPDHPVKFKQVTSYGGCIGLPDITSFFDCNRIISAIGTRKGPYVSDCDSTEVVIYGMTVCTAITTCNDATACAYAYARLPIFILVCIIFCISLVAGCVHWRDRQWTLASLAAHGGHTACLDWLISVGADPHAGKKSAFDIVNTEMGKLENSTPVTDWLEGNSLAEYKFAFSNVRTMKELVLLDDETVARYIPHDVHRALFAQRRKQISLGAVDAWLTRASLVAYKQSFCAANIDTLDAVAAMRGYALSALIADETDQERFVAAQAKLSFTEVDRYIDAKYPALVGIKRVLREEGVVSLELLHVVDEPLARKFFANVKGVTIAQVMAACEGSSSLGERTARPTFAAVSGTPAKTEPGAGVSESPAAAPVPLVGQPSPAVDSLSRHAINADELVGWEEIGSGEFGEVYRCRWGVTEVAVKKLKVGNISEEKKAAFEAEAKILSSLHHPHVVNFWGVSFSAKGMLIVTDFVGLGSLLSLLQRVDIQTLDLVYMAKQVVAGLDYIHNHGILHNDLAARNVLVDRDSRGSYVVRLADFGLSVHSGESVPVNIPLCWSAPETFGRKKGSFTQQSDIWSLGVVLWEMFARGAMPYEGMSSAEVCEAVTNGHTLTPPGSCPAPVKEVMVRCWALDPEKRPTLREVDDALRAVNMPTNYVPNIYTL